MKSWRQGRLKRKRQPGSKFSAICYQHSTLSLDTRFSILDTRFWMLDARCWILDAGYPPSRLYRNWQNYTYQCFCHSGIDQEPSAFSKYYVHGCQIGPALNSIGVRHDRQNFNAFLNCGTVWKAGIQCSDYFQLIWDFWITRNLPHGFVSIENRASSIQYPVSYR